MLGSPNHPDAVDGEIAVEAGDSIPNVPRHLAKADLLVPVGRLDLAASVSRMSSQFLRGDEANQLQPIDPATTVNLMAGYRLGRGVTLTARVTNVFNTHPASFGVLGEADDVLGDELRRSAVSEPVGPAGRLDRHRAAPALTDAVGACQVSAPARRISGVGHAVGHHRRARRRTSRSSRWRPPSSSWPSSTRSPRPGSRRGRIASSTGTTRRPRASDRVPTPSVAAEILHFFGEVEVVFGLWAVRAGGGDDLPLRLGRHHAPI